MCCEICPRFTNCEEEGHINELCCAACADYSSCHGKDRAGSKSEDELEDELDEV